VHVRLRGVNVERNDCDDGNTNSKKQELPPRHCWSRNQLPAPGGKTLHQLDVFLGERPSCKASPSQR
jgi:hypothetical protein